MILEVFSLMSRELLAFVVMIGVFLLGCFVCKLAPGISMMAASLAGALVGGEGLALRHLVEGTFSYIDTILIIASAMIFMRVIEASGALDAITSVIVERFHKVPALMLCFIMLIIMFPAMITGSDTASVLTAGSIMVPVLILMGVPPLETACILAMGGMLGMIAPPTNIPAMIIGGGIDIPYVGFAVPLILLTFPLAFLFALMFGYKYVKKVNYLEIKGRLNLEIREKYGLRIYIPLVLAIVLMILNKAVPAIPDMGMPLVFLISAVVGCFTGNKLNLAKQAKEAINSVLPVMGILMGVGMFLQVMTVTGVRGLIVTACMAMPNLAKYAAIAIMIPLFGAVSSYGAASVLGVPFLLSFLAKDEIVVASALSLISGVGDMVPPTALAGIFAAQVVGLDNYVPVMKKCLLPVAIMIVWGLLFIVFADQLAPFIVFT